MAGHPEPGPHPAVAAIRAAVRAELADLAPGSRVLVACSGGPDSLALAAATAFVAPRSGHTAGAVVVDHGWSPDSARVAAAAADACRALGLDPVDVIALVPDGLPGGSGGPEATARNGRYEALRAAATRQGAPVVLLGHTRDDQAETVLLRLARGSGARSLAGMPRRRGPFRRPLLDVPRATTWAACAALGLQPWQDPANADPAYTRSRLRAALPSLEAALGPALVPALARTADLLREDAEALDALAADLLARATLDRVQSWPVPGGAASAGPGPGSAFPGGPVLGSSVPGSAIPGSSIPGGPGPGTPRPGTPVPGTAEPGIAGEGTAEPGIAGEGTAERGSSVVGVAVRPLALDPHPLMAAPAAVRRRVLLAAARAVGCPAGALARGHVLAVDALITRWRGQGPVHLPGRIVAYRECGTLLLAPAGSARPGDRPAGEGAPTDRPRDHRARDHRPPDQE